MRPLSGLFNPGTIHGPAHVDLGRILTFLTVLFFNRTDKSIHRVCLDQVHGTPTKACARHPCTNHTRSIPRDLDELVEFGSAHFVVALQALVRRSHEPTERFEITVSQRCKGQLCTRNLRDHVPTAPVSFLSHRSPPAFERLQINVAERRQSLTRCQAELMDPTRTGRSPLVVGRIGQSTSNS